MRHPPRPAIGSAWLLAAACGSGTTDPPPAAQANCGAPAAIVLAPGGHQVVDPNATQGCVRLPGADAAGASYLVTILSAAGRQSTAGVQGGYHLAIGPELAAGNVVAGPAAPEIQPRETPSLPLRFHHFLREKELEFAARPELHLRPSTDPQVQLVPPAVGSERKFGVCRTPQCTAFDTVTAVARAVGTSIAVYLDKDAPDFDPFQQADLDDFQRTVDQFHLPIIRQAFGDVSDLDNNGIIIMLLTPAVNNLTTECSGGLIFGYFWPGDMLTIPGSNRGEIFYALTPAPAKPGCSAVSRAAARRILKPTLIHELQHMVNYNEKVLVRGATTFEEIWLNEGMSHYAEELAGRLIPDVECPESPSCRSQYISGNLTHLYDYLEDTEANYLVFPRQSTGTLAERGAVWSFVRWLTDHFGADSTGKDLTLKLTKTTLFGGDNVQAATGADFARSAGEWLSALYLDDLPGFTGGSPRLSFRWWNFRATFEANCCQAGRPFPTAWPFTPPLVTGAFTRNGTLRGGSGRHFQVDLPPTGPAFDVLLARQAGGLTVDQSLAPRVAVVRLR